MKKLILLLLLFVSIVFGCIDVKKNNLDKLNLNGNVESISETSYNAISIFGKISKGDKQREQIEVPEGWLPPPPDFDSYLKFNEEGNVIEKIEFDINGNVVFRWTYVYNDKSNLIQENWYRSERELINRYIYK